ncbi:MULTISPECIES: hypothetical protein [Prosthecochloris]|uniref:ATP synthase subunit I n=1 Tax=Prosthecochloris marina TaxID=2017681 RepID=A0A317T7B0_9CHLB|nr:MULTISPECIES: hypothetical protein [Prosthecochloris]PWW81331.1 hypothetical protein CR164_10890 [Prosthecochloris marina]UZJ37588.1 hypothetical protein OO005_12710 [Prosthecochloris sp. SCSIO W1103]UZJ39407.1 hypothetical protein OO185_05615 [Prosthecochloris sp. SCSIO W1102]UZJ42806.1 hypothetical protein OO006_13785 [Prosthecochloris sp. SCSIO W1101]
MKPLFDFLIKILILSVILWGVIFWSATEYNIDLGSVFVAWILIAANSLIGYLLFELAYDKSQAEYTKVVFGGLVLRLLVLMVLLAVIILQSLVVINDFVVSFFAFYCIYVIVEILGYQKKNKQKKRVA